MTIRNRDIIIVGQQSWDTEIGSNCKNIALEFAKQNRVLYVSTPLDRITKFRNKKGQDNGATIRQRVIQKRTPQIEEVAPNLWVWYHDVLIESINWIKYEWAFDMVNKSNNAKLAKSISRGIEMLNFNNYILFNDGDMFRSFYLKELLSPTTTIYYCRDNYRATQYWKKHSTIWEPRIIAQSDVCMVNSAYLGDYCKRYNSNTYYVGQGCDFKLFTLDQQLPEDMMALKLQEKPIIGYVGALLSSRLDVNLLEQLTFQNPSLSFVFIGPEDDTFKNSSLHSLSNVHFINTKKPEELPAYISSFDVCLNPQIVNELTIGNYPRKIDEYLALGKPVVATQTKAMDMFQDYVFLANSLSSYQSLIQQALEPFSKSEVADRIAFAHSHSWESSVLKIYDAICKTETVVI